ncbi:MAG: integration host factor subunit beta [Phycisphaerales bacterium]|nr:integration host factor subunit beta [Phycisphaerales bacterium]
MQTTITKKDLVDRISEKTGNKRVLVKRVIQQFLDEIVRELGEGNRLEFRDFGVFEIRRRAARIAQNPKTMEKVPVPEKRTVKFKVGRLMKQRLFSPKHAPMAASGVTAGHVHARHSVAAHPAVAAQPAADSV